MATGRQLFILPDDGAAGDRLGISLASSGNTAVQTLTQPMPETDSARPRLSVKRAR